MLVFDYHSLRVVCALLNILLLNLFDNLNKQCKEAFSAWPLHKKVFCTVLSWCLQLSLSSFPTSFGYYCWLRYFIYWPSISTSNIFRLKRVTILTMPRKGPISAIRLRRERNWPSVHFCYSPFMAYSSSKLEKSRCRIWSTWEKGRMSTFGSASCFLS